jgi:hypothetical protein
MQPDLRKLYNGVAISKAHNGCCADAYWHDFFSPGRGVLKELA